MGFTSLFDEEVASYEQGNENTQKDRKSLFSTFKHFLGFALFTKRAYILYAFVLLLMSPVHSLFTYLFPIKREEKKSVEYLCILQIQIIFIFTLLKTNKHIYIVKQVFFHDHTICFFKRTLIFPITVLLVILYIFLTKHFSTRKIFYGFMGFFFGFFFIYVFVLLPYQGSYTPALHADQLERNFPSYKDWILAYRYWMHSLFYLMAEMWGQFIIMIGFWGFVGEWFSAEAAGRIYPLFVIAGCIGGLLGTSFVRYWFTYFEGDDDSLMRLLIPSLLLSIAFLTLSYAWMTHYHFIGHTPPPKSSMAFWKGATYVTRHRYLRWMFLLILCSTLAIGISDAVYARFLRDVAVSKNQDDDLYILLVTDQHLLFHMICFIGTCLLSSRFVQRFSWSNLAYIPPITICIVVTCFFAILWEGTASYLLGFGSFQMIISLFVKFVFFDVAKEMIYADMNPEARKQGKPVIDILGSRLGKALANYLYWKVFTLFEAQQVKEVIPVLWCFFVFVCILWLLSVFKLRCMNAKQNKNTFILQKKDVQN